MEWIISRLIDDTLINLDCQVYVGIEPGINIFYLISIQLDDGSKTVLPMQNLHFEKKKF